MKTLAVIVNYRAAELAAAAAESLLWPQPSALLQVVVVDNSCDNRETTTLRRTLPDSVELLSPDTNLGFGAACNLAVARHASDAVLLLNPDARLLPGALARLQATLQERPEVGALAPQLYWDDRLQYLMPPAYPIILFFLDLMRFHSAWPSLFTNGLDRLWRRYAFRAWRARSPVSVLNLSGAAVLIRRRALPSRDRLFDPRFFLYFEDSDLFLRMRRAGWRLVLDPRARAVHYYDQCGQADWVIKRALMATSRDLFMAKHYPRLAHWRRRNLRRQPPVRPQHTGELTFFQQPFRVQVPGHWPWLFEWSPQPDFIPAMGRFGTGSTLIFSRQDWDRLAPGTYYGRVGPRPGYSGPCARFRWIIPSDRRRSA